MITNELGIELLDFLQRLRVEAQVLSQDAKQPFSHEVSLEHLKKVVSSIGLKSVSKPPEQKQIDISLQQWNEYQAGKRDRLEGRAVRYLCWEPYVATGEKFQKYLDKWHPNIRSRWLQGLVRSCHAHWPSMFAASSVAKQVRHRLETYQGTNRLLLQWRDASTMILGPQGPEEFAAYMVKARIPIKAVCDAWTVDEQTPYVLEAVRQAAWSCRNHMGQGTNSYNHYLLNEILPWPGWSLEEFKTQVGHTILHPAATEVPEIRESLKRLVLGDNRLSDPRLPRNAKNWIGVPNGACDRFIQWLSSADIEFFFEHVLPRGKDPHGRKAFWLQYVKRVIRSRPLLSQKDEARLQWNIKEQIGHFGRIDGTTSAFLLDFGQILVVEFSMIGNACYLYDKTAVSKVVPDFWMLQPFRELKQRRICVTRINHKPVWQYETERILARYGIRSV